MQMTQTGSRTETRLERHRRAFLFAKQTGPLLRIDELAADEIELINFDFLEKCRGKTEDIDAIYSAYVEVLHLWGVMCPHPQHQRMYGGFQRTDVPLTFDEAKWFDCRLCKASVINR